MENIRDSKDRLSQFMERVKSGESIRGKLYPTGIGELDKALNGGFTAGLHCIGALPGLGKSSLALQIADHLAAGGTASIMFSLEMKAADIAVKSISRQTYIDGVPLSMSRIYETPELLSREEYADAYHESMYRAEYISVIECGSEPYRVSDISDYVKNYVQKYGVKPFVIVDYLQILDAPDRYRSSTDKQVADYNLKRLKGLSDYLDIPIFLISSLNRENYDSDISFKAFKDSGNIEYSCDTVMGMQYKSRSSSSMYSNPRQLEIVMLKQRYGEAGKRVNIDFYPEYSLFRKPGKTERY